MRQIARSPLPHGGHIVNMLAASEDEERGGKDRGREEGRAEEGREGRGRAKEGRGEGRVEDPVKGPGEGHIQERMGINKAEVPVNMSATEAVSRLKESLDAILKKALNRSQDSEEPDQVSSGHVEQRTSYWLCQTPQQTHDELASAAMTAAKDLELIFERAKLGSGAQTDEEVQQEILELETIIAEKDALLKKSLELISSWESKFAAYKKTHDPLLFKT
eukprot:767714-Hanusia_phi.AAC.6